MSLNYDAHIHMGLPTKKITDDEICERLKGYADAGITFLRDGGDNSGISLRAKQLSGMCGVDYRTPAFAIHKNGHYGSFLGRGFDDMDGYKALVDSAINDGADFIKIIISGIMDFSQYGVLADDDKKASVITAADFTEKETEVHDCDCDSHEHEHAHGDNSDAYEREHERVEQNGYIATIYEKNGETGGLTAEEISEMISYVHEKGLAVMAHCNGATNIKAALVAGADSIEHGFYMDDECVDLLSGSDTVWVPTITPVASLIGKGKYDDGVLKLIVANHVKNISRVWYLGGMIALGTDAGAADVPHITASKSEYNFLKAAIGTKDFDAHLSMSAEQLKWKFS